MNKFEINKVVWDEGKEIRIENIGLFEDIKIFEDSKKGEAAALSTSKKKRRMLNDYIVEIGHSSPDFVRNRGKKYETSKDLIKESFGKQMTCKNYSHRVWIWSMSNSEATLYLLYSVRGMSFSYKDGSNIDEVVKLYKEVVDCMNNILNK